MALTRNHMNNLIHAANINAYFGTSFTVTHTFLVDGHQITQLWWDTKPNDNCVKVGDVSHQVYHAGGGEPMRRVVKMLRSEQPHNPILNIAPMRELRALAVFSRPEVREPKIKSSELHLVNVVMSEANGCPGRRLVCEIAWLVQGPTQTLHSHGRPPARGLGQLSSQRR